MSETALMNLGDAGQGADVLGIYCDGRFQIPYIFPIPFGDGPKLARFEEQEFDTLC
jgi:hypothetical protein